MGLTRGLVGARDFLVGILYVPSLANKGAIIAQIPSAEQSAEVCWLEYVLDTPLL